MRIVVALIYGLDSFPDPNLPVLRKECLAQFAAHQADTISARSTWPLDLGIPKPL